MKPSNPSPRDELAEPLRSILEDIARGPVPEDLIQHARRFSVPIPPKAKPQRSAWVIVVSILALSLCIAALVVREQSSIKPLQLAEEILPVPTRQTEEIPPPTLWAYRQASQSPGGLDELLSHHASVLLPDTPRENIQQFRLFSRKEEL